ncbi:MAG: ATP-binding protein [Propionibacteriaceae bacterium]|jgi:predicted AAA+ superfamily ATPase|nr:ATP-binding protein [Propionibacteriaceae bacterium]
MIGRVMERVLAERLGSFAAVVLLGARQVGKTTLARAMAAAWPGGATYLDLERPADQRLLGDADSYLRSQAGRLTVLDEVHRLPELFPVLRGVIDDNRAAGRRTGQFLLLGSASLDLLRGADESLAGRVSHLDLGGIAPDEAADAGFSLDRLWLRGGFPDSLTAGSDAASLQWRSDLIRSYLERDIPFFAPRLPAATLRRLWTMLAHLSGGLFNASQLGASTGVSGQTIDRYVDLLADLGLVRRLMPWYANVGRRLVKRPKVYVRDTGLLHALLELGAREAVLSHPAAGGSFESLCVESLIAAAPGLQPHFYRTATGDEIDLVLCQGDQPRVGVEVKLSSAPTLSAGFHRACADLKLDRCFLVHPDDGRPPYQDGNVEVIGLTDLTRRLRSA